MVYRQRKKRRRGTHGRGSSKNHRGAGNRGGRGKAGRGKKALHKKFEQMRQPRKKGFQRPFSSQKRQAVINLDDIAKQMAALQNQGFIYEENDVMVFDADAAGFKVLGKGNLPDNMYIKASLYSRTVAPYVVS